MRSFVERVEIHKREIRERRIGFPLPKVKAMAAWLEAALQMIEDCEGHVQKAKGSGARRWNFHPSPGENHAEFDWTSKRNGGNLEDDE